MTEINLQTLQQPKPNKQKTLNNIKKIIYIALGFSIIQLIFTTIPLWSSLIGMDPSWYIIILTSATSLILATLTLIKFNAGNYKTAGNLLMITGLLIAINTFFLIFTILIGLVIILNGYILKKNH